MNRSTSLSLRLLPLLTVVALVAACSGGSGSVGTLPPPPPTDAPSVDVPSPEPTPNEPSPTPGTPSPSPDGSGSPIPNPSPEPSPTGSTIVRAYFFMPDPITGEPGLVPVLRQVPVTRAVATAAMEALLAGPNQRERAGRPELVTTIPAGTQLLGIRIDNRVAIVNLSKEYESGGGSLSIFGRLAQVVYTLTQFPTVDSVRFELDGKPVTVFSGEGLILDKAATRADFREVLPEIFVDRPAWGAAAGNPARITGETRVFEATFHAQLRDARGRVLVEETVTASCGTGCWGTFDVTLRYTVSDAQWGVLRVYESSAKDGSDVNIVEYPVWLTPRS
jgi:germination protein M